MHIELTDRERGLLIGGGVLIGLVIVYFGIHSIFRWLDNVQIKKNRILNDRQEILSYGQQHNLLKSLAVEVSSRSQQRDITPIIENLIESNSLIDKVRSVNPSNSVVEKKYIKSLVTISLRDISAEEFLTFIKSVENYQAAFLKIDYFNSRPALKKPGLYNCQIKIATFTKRN